MRVSRRVEMGATGVRAMGMHDDVEALKEELARTRRELEFAHEELKVCRGPFWVGISFPPRIRFATHEKALSCASPPPCTTF